MDAHGDASEIILKGGLRRPGLMVVPTLAGGVLVVLSWTARDVRAGHVSSLFFPVGILALAAVVLLYPSKLTIGPQGIAMTRLGGSFSEPWETCENFRAVEYVTPQGAVDGVTLSAEGYRLTKRERAATNHEKFGGDIFIPAIFGGLSSHELADLLTASRERFLAAEREN